MKDIVLVVVGVLLAFGIESRWSDIQEKREDRGYLQAVGQELEDDVRALGGFLAVARSADAAADTLRMAREGRVDLPATSIPRLVWRATSAIQAELTSPSLESLFSSAAWARMSDPELRTALTALDQSLSEHERSTRQASEYWFRAFEPVLRTRIDYDEWALGFSDPARLESSPSLGDWSQLLHDREITNLLVHSEWFAEGVIPRVGVLRDRIEDVIARLSGPDAN